MVNLLDQIVRFFKASWTKGTPFARLVIAILLSWPLVLIGTACVLPPPAALAVVPLVTILCLFVILLGSKLAIVELGLARFIARVIVPYLLIGLYCSFIPLSEGKGLVPAVALIWYVILFLCLGGQEDWGWLVAAALIFFSIIFFPGTMRTIRSVAAGPGKQQTAIGAATDAEIVRKIEARLYSDPQAAGADLRITVKGGSVIVDGRVASNAVRNEILSDCAGTPGVTKVTDRMIVQSPPDGSFETPCDPDEIPEPQPLMQTDQASPS